jgi:hypothetical protein
VPTPPRWLPLVLLPFFVALAPAAPAFATLSQASGAAAGAHFTGDDELGTEGPGAGGGLVSNIDVFAMESQENVGYVDDFQWQASFAGSGLVNYGFVTVDFSAFAESKPESTESIPPGNPRGNDGQSFFDGVVALKYEEMGVVTGPTPGAPVTLEITVDTDGGASFTGGNPSITRNAQIGTDVFVIDVTNNSNGHHIVFFGPSTQMRTLDTAVGNAFSISGKMLGLAECTAGANQGFVQTCSAQGGGTTRLWFTLPAGFGFESDSGHDYPTPTPAPGRALLACTGALGHAARPLARRRASAGRFR